MVRNARKQYGNISERVPIGETFDNRRWQNALNKAVNSIVRSFLSEYRHEKAFSKEFIQALINENYKFVQANQDRLSHRDVHAELKIVQELFIKRKIGREDKNQEYPYYIGVSKRCCITCDNLIKSINYVFTKKHFNLLKETFYEEYIARRDRHGYYFPSGCPEFMEERNDIINKRVRKVIEKNFLKRMSKLGFGGDTAWLVFGYKCKQVYDIKQSHPCSPSPANLWEGIEELLLTREASTSTSSTALQDEKYDIGNFTTLTKTSSPIIKEIIGAKIEKKLKKVIESSEEKEGGITFKIRGEEEQIREYLEKKIGIGEKSIDIEKLEGNELRVSIKSTERDHLEERCSKIELSRTGKFI